jgi:hypothetical protein
VLTVRLPDPGQMFGLPGVDRLHPNERGHRLIACRFHGLLATAGYPVGDGPDPEPSSLPPTRRAEFGWMATKGTAWMFRRSRDLVPALASLAAKEWLAADRDRLVPPAWTARSGGD